ncbi:hypothetical protein ANTQUA_LOCUS1202 [Anthophora quadrimaculata]
MANNIKGERQRIRVNLEAANAEKPTEVRGSVEQFQERGRMKNDCTRRRRRRMPSLADSVAPNAVYPPFFLGRGNKEVGPLLKKTESRQYRAGPVDCLRKQ